jgi:hypothetical protein
MSHLRSPLDRLTAPDAQAGVRSLPEDAVSADIEDTTSVLHASQLLQIRFEMLLDKRKTGTLSPQE